MWVKSLIAYVSKLLVAVTPFLVVPFLVKEEGDHPWLTVLLSASAANVQQRAIAAFTMLDLSALATYETFTHFLPQRQARRVADVFVNSLFDEFRNVISEQGLELGADIRINVMFVRRSVFTLFMPRFVWFANRGFEGAHHDNGIWLLVAQGLCGRAFRDKRTLSVDLRTPRETEVPWWPCRDNFWMLPWQRKRTAHLTAILTIPIFAEEHLGLMRHHRSVGVINVDAVSDLGAERLLSNKTRLDKFFKDSGKILALLAPR